MQTYQRFFFFHQLLPPGFAVDVTGTADLANAFIILLIKALYITTMG